MNVTNSEWPSDLAFCKWCDVIKCTSFQKMNLKNLRSFAQCFVHRSGCTYRCWQSFYAMELIQQIGLIKAKTFHALLIPTRMDWQFWLQLISNMTLQNWLLIFSHKNRIRIVSIYYSKIKKSSNLPSCSPIASVQELIKRVLRVQTYPKWITYCFQSLKL